MSSNVGLNRTLNFELTCLSNILWFFHGNIVCQSFIFATEFQFGNLTLPATQLTQLFLPPALNSIIKKNRIHKVSFLLDTSLK